MSRFLCTDRSYELLEPYEGKLSRTVLRGERGSNAPALPDNNFRRLYLSLLRAPNGGDELAVIALLFGQIRLVFLYQVDAAQTLQGRLDIVWRFLVKSVIVPTPSADTRLIP